MSPQDMSDNANSSDLNRQLKNLLHQAVEEDRLNEVMQVIQGSGGQLSSAMSSAGNDRRLKASERRGLGRDLGDSI